MNITIVYQGQAFDNNNTTENNSIEIFTLCPFSASMWTSRPDFFSDLQERVLEYLEKWTPGFYLEKWTPGEMVLSTCDEVLMEEPGLAKVVTTIGCLSKETTIF